MPKSCSRMGVLRNGWRSGERPGVRLKNLLQSIWQRLGNGESLLNQKFKRIRRTLEPMGTAKKGIIVVTAASWRS